MAGKGRNGNIERARERDRARKKRQTGLLRYLKAEMFRQCAVCAKPYDPDRAIDFHFEHTNPTTKIANVGKVLYNHGVFAMVGELVKCVMLCADCHRWKTRFDRIAARMAA